MPEDDVNTGVTDPDAGGGKQDDDQDQPVTREAFVAMRKDLQIKIDELSDQNQLLRAHFNMGRQGGGAGREASGEADDPLKDRDGEDVLTVAEYRQLRARDRAQIAALVGEMRQSHQAKDYAEVIKTHLPNYLKDHPEDLALLQATLPEARPRLAYLLGTRDPAYQAKKSKEKLETGGHEDAARIAANKGKPNLAGKGDRAAVSAQERFGKMSDQEFERHIANVKAGRV